MARTVGVVHELLLDGPPSQWVPRLAAGVGGLGGYDVEMPTDGVLVVTRPGTPLVVTVIAIAAVPITMALSLLAWAVIYVRRQWSLLVEDDGERGTRVSVHGRHRRPLVEQLDNIAAEWSATG